MAKQFTSILSGWTLALLLSSRYVQALQQLTPAHLLVELPLSNSENLDVFKVLIAMVQRWAC
jgi:hypothetical protein